MFRRLVVMAILAGVCAAHCAAAAEDQPKVLNNLVTQLLKVEGDGIGQEANYTFTNPRAGWVYVGVTFSGQPGPGVALAVNEQDVPDPRAAGEAGGLMREAMRFLPAGQHKLAVKGESGAGIKSVVVRAVAELMYSTYGSNPQIQEYGKFDLAYLQKNVFPNLNCMIFRSTNLDILEAWKKEGKRAIEELYAAPYLDRSKTWTADDAFKYWTASAGMSHPLLDGVIVDEFGRENDPKFQIIIDSVKQLLEDPKFKGRVYYPYCGTMYGNEKDPGQMSEAFNKLMLEHGQKIAWERYLHEKATLDEARKYLEDRLVKEAQEWEKKIPGAIAGMIMCFGHMISAPNETVNSQPNVDHKYFMDMQFNIIANHPVYKGLYGVMEYLSSYTDEEYFRWAIRLYRHYCIEGHTEMLSDKYGYTFLTNHLENPDFDRKLEGWTLEPAEEGSITAGQHKQYSWLQGRYPPTPQGDTFLLTKRSAAKPNVFSQAIKNLKAGELYNLKLFTGDYGDLTKDISRWERHVVTIKVDNVDRIGSKCFQSVFANCYSHHAGKFNKDHKYWMNYHQIVFRAKAPTAKLTVSDWSNPPLPGGPAGQQLMFNFFEVQPYYE